MKKDRINLYLDRDKLKAIQYKTGEDYSDIVEKALDLYLGHINAHYPPFLHHYIEIKARVEKMEILELDEDGKMILDAYKKFLSKADRLKVVQDLKPSI
jgi:hypothetical protein